MKKGKSLDGKVEISTPGAKEETESKLEKIVY